MKSLVIKFIACMLLSSCLSRGGYFDQTEPLLEKEDPQTVVLDAGKLLQESFPPAKSKLHLQVDPKKHKLGSLLESELRRIGYAIDTSEKGQGIKIAYLFDRIDQKRYMFRIVAGENFQANRIYKKLGSSFVSETPFAVRGIIR